MTSSVSSSASPLPSLPAARPSPPLKSGYFSDRPGNTATITGTFIRHEELGSAAVFGTRILPFTDTAQTLLTRLEESGSIEVPDGTPLIAHVDVAGGRTTAPVLFIDKVHARFEIQTEGNSAAFKNFIKAYTAAPDQVSPPPASYRVRDAHEDLTYRFIRVPEEIAFIDHTGKSHLFTVPRSMRPETGRPLSDYDRSRIIRVLCHRDGRYQSVATPQDGKGTLYRYTIPSRATQDAGTTVELTVVSKTKSETVTVETVTEATITFPGPPSRTLNLKFSDPTRHARAYVAAFMGETNLAAEPFNEKRSRIVRDSLLDKHLGESSWKFDALLQKALDKPPKLPEIEQHIRHIEQSARKWFACERTSLEWEAGLPPEQERQVSEQTRQDFDPVPGRMILFEDRRGLKLLRAKQDGSGFQLMANIGRWEDFDIVAHMDEGKASAARNEISYRASYIINKIGLVYDLRKGGQVAIPGQRNLERKHIENMALYKRQYGNDSKNSFKGRYVNKVFWAANVGRLWGSYRTSDDSVEFLKALGVTELSRHQTVLDLFANLGEPLEVLRLENFKGTEFMLETHPVVVTKYDDFNTPIVTHYRVHAAVRDDVVLMARINHADTDMRTFMSNMSQILTRSNSSLQIISAGRGQLPIENPCGKGATAPPLRDFEAVTLHLGTPYEIQLHLECMSSNYLLEVFEGKGALGKFTKEVNTSDKKWVVHEIARIALASPNVSTVARTIDFDVLQYEFLLENNNAAGNGDTNGTQCIAFAVVVPLSEAKRITVNVHPFLKDKAPSINHFVTQMIDMYKKNPKRSRLSHFHKMQILSTSPIPTVTGRREMVAIGNFWMTKSYYAEASEHKDLDQCLRSIGLDRQHRESFFRRALESCRQSKNYLKVDDARLTPYKILIRHPTIIENKEFTVWIGHHGDHARNLILYANIVPGWNARPSERGDVIRDMFSKMPELIALSNSRINSAIAPNIPLPERPSLSVFNLVLDGKNRIFRTMGNFVVSASPLPGVYEKAYNTKKGINKVVSTARKKSAEVVRAYQRQLGKPRFLETVLTNAEECFGDPEWCLYEEKHFTVRFYNTEISGQGFNHAFKIGILMPFPYYRNLAISINLELAQYAESKRMLSVIRAKTMNDRSPIMVAINKMKERGETLPEEVTIPEHVREKQQRITAYRDEANDDTIDEEIDEEIDDVNDDDDDENIDDEVDDDDDENIEDADEDNISSNRPATYLTFKTAKDYYEATIADVTDREQIKTRVRQAIDGNQSLRILHTGPVPRSEYTQLIALGELWSAFVKIPPLPPSATVRQTSSLNVNSMLFSGDMMIDQAVLRPSSDQKKDMPPAMVAALEKQMEKQNEAAAMVAALEIVDFANKAFHPDLGITFAVSGNVFEPAARMDGEIISYEDIINWADQQPDGGIQAARQMLNWMNGRTTLANLPRHLRMLAVHTHYVDTGRDRHNRLDGLKTRMQEISGGTLTRKISWNTLGDVYPPARRSTEDADSDYVDDDDMSIYSGNSEDLSELVDEPPDFLEKLKSSAQQEDELVPPTWTIPGTLVDALKKEHGDEPVDIVMKHLENRKYDTEPARDEYGRIRKGWVKCRLPLEHGNVPTALLFKHHEGNVTRVEFIHDDAMDID
jgi:hypothetical protein